MFISNPVPADETGSAANLHRGLKWTRVIPAARFGKRHGLCGKRSLGVGMGRLSNWFPAVMGRGRLGRNCGASVCK